MRSDSFLRLLFVIYCLEAGVFLALVPWSRGWTVLLGRLPAGFLPQLLAEPGMRAALSAFGAVHLLWAVHDLVTLVRRRREAQPAAPGDVERTP